MVDLIWPSPVTHDVSDDFPTHVARGSVNPGLDITCGYGSRVNAAAAGRITGMSRSNSGSGGRYIQITHDDGWITQYLHLSEIEVSLGQRVEQGQEIARSGASGFGSDWGYGPHLHWSLKIGGRNVNPYGYVGGTGTGSSIASGNSTPINATPTETDEEMSATEMYIRRELTGRVALFKFGIHGTKANPDGSPSGVPEVNRREFFSPEEYADHRSMRQSYNDNLQGDEANVRRGKLYVPPANTKEILGVTEGGWADICSQFGV